MIMPGEVWLVGAGPGDPDLLTRKAERLLRSASVVFHDALAGPEVLALAAASARLVSVGKRAGRHSKDQPTIDALIVAAAQAGERVVRLKGGDPAIFGRTMEELAACRAAGITVQICPGITAASAAAASLGTALTLRAEARQVTYVTAHAKKGDRLALDWAALARRDATLAVYMGKAAAAEVASQLMAHGLPADTPVAWVESASLPGERRFRTRLDLLPLAARTALGDGPAIVLIGQVAASQPYGAVAASTFSRASAVPQS